MDSTETPTETTSSTGDYTTETTDHDETTQITLSKKWELDFGVDYIWIHRNRFLFNDWNRAASAIEGDGLLWENEVQYEGSSSNLGMNVFADGGDIVVFGYLSEPESVENPGAHFAAFNWHSGDEKWTFTRPVQVEGGYIMPRGAAIQDGIAVVSTEELGPGDDGPRQRNSIDLYGIDVETGELVWDGGEIGQQLTRSQVDNIYAHGDEVLVIAENVYGIAPTTGAINQKYDSLTGGTALNGESLFGLVDDKLHAFPLTDAGVEWQTETLDIENISTGPVVDNSLVVIGTQSGAVQAFDRTTGEKRWENTISNRVWKIVTSGTHVWAADQSTGLVAYSRSEGSTVLRSSQPIDGGDIAVYGDTVLLGSDRARALEINYKE